MHRFWKMKHFWSPENYELSLFCVGWWGAYGPQERPQNSSFYTVSYFCLSMYDLCASCVPWQVKSHFVFEICSLPTNPSSCHWFYHTPYSHLSSHRMSVSCVSDWECLRFPELPRWPVTPNFSASGLTALRLDGFLCLQSNNNKVNQLWNQTVFV